VCGRASSTPPSGSMSSGTWSAPHSMVSSTCCTWRPRDSASRAPRTSSTSCRSPSSPSMRHTASRNGVTTSVPTTCVCRCSVNAGRTCRASRSPPPRLRPPDGRSSSASGWARLARSWPASTGRTSVTASSRSSSPSPSSYSSSALSTRATPASCTACHGRRWRRPRRRWYGKGSRRCRTTRVFRPRCAPQTKPGSCARTAW